MVHEPLDEIIDKHAQEKGACEHCKKVVRLVATPSQTMYEVTEENPDPNRDHYYCEQCSRAYTEFIEEQWANYNSGRL